MLGGIGLKLVTDFVGQPVSPIFKDQAWPLKMGLIGCPKMSVTIYQPMTYNILESEGLIAVYKKIVS